MFRERRRALFVLGSGDVKIVETTFEGHEAIELTDRKTRMLVMHDAGPRIAFFGKRDGENLLYWDRGGDIRRGAWRLYGGHRLWVTRSGADEGEETYEEDNARCEWQRLDRDGVEVTSVTRARIEKTLSIRSCGGGVWTVEHRLRNLGDMLWAGGAWGVTVTAPRRTTRYAIPLDGGDPSWDVVSIVIPRRWGGGHTTEIADPQFTLARDALEIRSRGREGKRMVYAPRGMLVMIDPARGTFTKATPAVAGAQYPYGTNVAVYLAPKSVMVELETMSPALTLLPAHALVHVETWSLR